METKVSPDAQKTQAPLLILGILFIITISTSLIPASWFGIERQVHTYKPLDLSALAQPSNLVADANSDGTISWKEFVAGSLGIPAEQASTDIESDPRTIAALNDPNNLTSSFSKNLYMASVALNQSGISDQASEKEVINKLVQEEVDKLVPTVYTANDLRIGNDDSKTALKAYGNSMASILQGMITEQSITSDLRAVTKFIESENEADLVPVIKSKARIESVLEKLLSTTVPRSASGVHLETINAVGKFADTLQNLSRAYDDPMRATVGVQNYSENAVLALRSVPKLGLFFNSKNIVFSGKEPGYLFTAGYTNR